MLKPEEMHFFNLKYENLRADEEEIFYRHPEYPLTCNQIGFVFADEGYELFENGWGNSIKLKGPDTDMPIGKLVKVIYECYYGVMLPYTHITFADGNPFNYRKENLIPDSIPDRSLFKSAWAAERAFWKRSGEYVKSKTVYLESKGLDPDLYWNILQICDFYWKKITGAKRTNSKFRPVKPVKHSESNGKAKQVHALMDENKSPKEIMEILGIKNPSMIAYYKRSYIKK